MCLAVPLRLESIDGKNGIGEFDGVRRKVRLDFVPAARIDDYVMVHAGFAIEIIEKQQAEDDRQAFREVLSELG